MNADDFITLHTGAANEQSARLVTRLALAGADDGLIALLAAVIKRALMDAKRRADPGAADFLDYIGLPDWRARRMAGAREWHNED